MGKRFCISGKTTPFGGCHQSGVPSGLETRAVFEMFQLLRQHFGSVQAGGDALSSFQQQQIFPMANNYWLVKSEPESYSWDALVKDKRTAWTGVRNFAARLHLRAMKKGDPVLFYHSVTDKQVVGLAKVEKEAYPDPTATEGDWSAVDLVPVKKLAEPVSLETIRTDELLKEMALVRQSRLSVGPLTERQFQHLMALAETKP